MKAGIVGLPNVGKSTLFNALTAAGAAASSYPFCTIDPNLGVMIIPDARLQQIHRHVSREKIVPAALQIVDIAGLVRGASRGEGLGNQFLAHIRQVDALLHVVRCFEDENTAHVEGTLDPIRDVEILETELLLADLQLVEAALEKARKEAKGGSPEAKERLALLEQCLPLLEAGKPVRELAHSHGREQRLLKGLGLLTSKPTLFVANVGEGNGEDPAFLRLRDFLSTRGDPVVALSARLEAELLELPEEERKEFLQVLGKQETALEMVGRETFRLLDLITFFTTRTEIRAWPVPAGSTADQAAGVIHTDFQRGFISAEVYRLEDLLELGSEEAVKAAGRLRLEGRSYLVQDGDICRFRFQV